MILYDIICDKDHQFESWFKSSAAYDRLVKARGLTCPVCGSSKVRKAPMAPSVAKSSKSPRSTKPAQPLGRTSEITKAMEKAETALKELRQTIEKNYENVGDQFPEEARKMHYGESEERGIYGEATSKEAKDLVEEGIEVVSIPFPKRTDS